MTYVHIVAGAQYGSEAKGHLVQILAREIADQGASLRVIRVAGPNAGHTGHDQDGNKYALRQVPVAAVVPGRMTLEIAAGSEIDLPVLKSEIAHLRNFGLLEDKTLVVHPEATLIDDSHKQAETELVGDVGSTGKGIGAARAARLMRKAKRLWDNPDAMKELVDLGVKILYTESWRPEGNIIIEGTQGYALGLHAGYYPHCTSSNTRAIDFLAMAGISPWDADVRVWLAARMYPIRVAGNSGHMEEETSWEELGLPQEHTTVTKKVRRVGQPDWELVKRAVSANGGPSDQVMVGLFMGDQMFPEIAGAYSPNQLPENVLQYIDDVEAAIGASIRILGTGPNSHVKVK